MAKGEDLTEMMIQKLHALVMGGGKLSVKPTTFFIPHLYKFIIGISSLADEHYNVLLHHFFHFLMDGLGGYFK